MPEVWVQSLAGEIRPHTLCTQAWPKIKIKESNTLFSYTSQDTPYSWIELFFYSLACVSCEVALSCQLMLDFVFHVLGGLTVFRTLCPSVKHIWISLVAQTIKCLPAMRETWVWFLGWEDPLEGEMAIHSSTLAWKIPWMEEPGRLQSMGSQRVRHDWTTSLRHINWWPSLQEDPEFSYFSYGIPHTQDKITCDFSSLVLQPLQEWICYSTVEEKVNLLQEFWEHIKIKRSELSLSGGLRVFTESSFSVWNLLHACFPCVLEFERSSILCVCVCVCVCV